MKVFNLVFATVATLAFSYFSMPDAHAYDPCERCYKQYDACIAAGTAAKTCHDRLLVCTQRYCN